MKVALNVIYFLTLKKQYIELMFQCQSLIIVVQSYTPSLFDSDVAKFLWNMVNTP